MRDMNPESSSDSHSDDEIEMPPRKVARGNQKSLV